MKTFSDVIVSASAESNVSSLGALWGTKEQNLRRWRDNPRQSPTFNDLQRMVRRMSPHEQDLVVAALLGASDSSTDDVASGSKILEQAESALVDCLSRLRAGIL